MWYQWGHGVGHTYSHHFLKCHKSEIQMDIEMEDSPVRLVVSIRGGPSSLGSTGLNNGDNFDDESCRRCISVDVYGYGFMQNAHPNKKSTNDAWNAFRCHS
jgi:hypothetical protein